MTTPPESPDGRRRDDAALITDDAILNGRLRLFQPKRGHRFGHDAILLAAAAPAEPDERLAELGAGVGAASLALLARVQGTDATLYEVNPALCRLAQENIARNGFAVRARIITADVTTLTRPLADAPPFDHVLMNPPFHDPRHPVSADKALAHAATIDLLPRWMATAHALLRDRGAVTLIWRADGLGAVLNALVPGFGGAAILPIYPGPTQDANRVIVSARKGAKAPGRVLAPLVLNDETGRPSEQAEAILRLGHGLPFGRR